MGGVARARPHDFASGLPRHFYAVRNRHRSLIDAHRVFSPKMDEAAAAASPVDYLSLDVLAFIFSGLPPSRLAVLSCTCSSWRTATSDSSLWRHATFGVYSAPPQTAPGDFNFHRQLWHVMASPSGYTGFYARDLFILDGDLTAAGGSVSVGSLNQSTVKNTTLTFESLTKISKNQAHRNVSGVFGGRLARGRADFDCGDPCSSYSLVVIEWPDIFTQNGMDQDAPTLQIDHEQMGHNDGAMKLNENSTYVLRLNVCTFGQTQAL